MTQRVNLDLQRALTNVEDGVHAVEIDDSEENIEYFASEATAALDAVPREVPYIENYRNALDRQDFERAFKALANFASYVEADEERMFDFSYQQGEIERIHDAYREFTS